MNILNKLRGFNHRYQHVIQSVSLAQANTQYGVREAEVLLQLLPMMFSNAKVIGERTSIPKLHLSRILVQLRKMQLIELGHSLTDRRMLHIGLTERGREEPEAVVCA